MELDSFTGIQVGTPSGLGSSTCWADVELCYTDGVTPCAVLLKDLTELLAATVFKRREMNQNKPRLRAEKHQEY